MALGRRLGLALAVIVAARPAFAQTAEPEPEPEAAPETAEVTRPVPLNTPAPLYPEGGKGDQVVVIELTVGVDGKVLEPKIVSGDPIFADRALAATRDWTFEPARRNGTPVAARVRFELRFTEPPPPEPEQAAPPAAAAPPPGAAPPPPKVEEPIELVVIGVRKPPDRVSLTRAEVRELPGTFGDPLRAIEVLPGVTPLASGVPYFYVRGSPPGNVGYFLDGIRVPLLYHFALGPSVIHPGIVERVDLYSGGYPARYGRYSGGIVAAETTPPRPEVHGEANVRLFDAGAMVEAPFADDRATALIGGRYSYTAGIISLVAPEVSLGYWDYQLRLGYQTAGKDKLAIFAFGSYDYFTVETTSRSFDGMMERTTQGEDGLSTEFHRVDLRHERRADARTLIKSALTLGYERTGNETLSGDEVDVLGQMVAVRSEVLHEESEQTLWRAGIDAEIDNYSAELAGQDDSTRTAFPTRLDYAAGVWGDVVLEPEPGFTLTPGLRLDGYFSDTIAALGIDPRISARFELSPRLAIEHAFGIAHQAPSFIVPIPGFAMAGLRDGLQRAIQTSSGVELGLPAKFTAKATVFQNAIFNLSDLLSIVREPEIADDANFDTRVRGHSYGLELMLRRPLTEKLGGYFAYTLSRSERVLDGQDFIASFDRTHVLHAALAYDLGKRWRAGTRFTFYTGTPPQLDRESISSTSLVPVPINPAAIPQERSPAFYRLDVRLEKKWLIGSKGAWWSFIVEVLNTTLHKEVLDYRCGVDGCRGEEFGPGSAL
jgi:hypothetical protein